MVHKDTAAKARTKVTQGEAFMTSMKKGDFFYLCRGNSIRLLGKIDSDEVEENSEKQDGWCERSYTVIAESKDKSPYSGEKSGGLLTTIQRVFRFQQVKKISLMI